MTSTAVEVRPRGDLQSLTRAFDLLDAVAASNGSNDLACLARRVHLHPATTLRYLRTLEHRGYIHHDREEGYRLGPRLYELGTTYAQAVSIIRHAEKLTADLSALTRETASVGILEGGSVLYVAITNGQQELGIQSHAGARHPAYCTSLGKAMLASMSWEDVLSVLGQAPLASFTPRTLIDTAALRSDLQRTALRGYSVEDEELLAGVVCIGAPIFDRLHRAVAAISISGPKARIQRRRWEPIGRQVLESAADASRWIGAPVRRRPAIPV